MRSGKIAVSGIDPLSGQVNVIILRNGARIALKTMADESVVHWSEE